MTSVVLAFFESVNGILDRVQREDSTVLLMNLEHSRGQASSWW